MNKPLNQDIDYLHGQIDAIKALIFAIARLHPAEDVLESFEARLEALRTALLAEPVAEARLIALDHMQIELNAHLR